MRSIWPTPRGRTLLVAIVALVAFLFPAFADIHAQRGRGQIAGQAVPRVPVADRAGLSPDQAEAFVDAAVRGLDYLPGEVLVKFRPGMQPAAQTRALAALRSRPTADALRWSPGGIARLRDASEPDAERLAALLRAQPEVELAQPNYIRRLPRRVAEPRMAPVRTGASPSRVPNDPSYGDLQWNLRLIDAPNAWTINPGGSRDVIVAVLDTGFSTQATVLTRPLWTGQRIELVPLHFDVTPDLPQARVVSARDEAFEPGSPPFDFDGHGTHVASTIAEEANNSVGLAGLAYNVRLMPVKVCVGFWEVMLVRAQFGIGGYVPTDAGGCADEDVNAGIRHAVDAGARVINLSFGGPSPSPVVRDAILYAISRGAFVAAAVGNSYDTDNAVDFPAGYAREIEGLMSVGAVGKSSTRAYYSSTGKHLEIVAPGGSNRDDDGGEDQGYVWQITLYPPDSMPTLSPRPRFDRYVEVGYVGTSMATPHVSGLAALLISQGVTDPRAIEAVIKRAARDLGSPGWDEEYGEGLIHARDSLFGRGIRR